MKKLLMVFAVLLPMLLGAQSVSATVVLRFDPVVTTVSSGSVFDVNVRATIPQDQGLVGWGFGLLFDDQQVQLQNVVSGSLWDLVFWPTSSTPLDPLVSLLTPSALSPADGAVGDDVLLATLTFLCLEPGRSLLDISVADPSVDPSQGFMTAAGDYAAWSSVAATINQVNQTPEPAVVLLVLTALGAAFWMRCGRNAS